MEDFLNAELRLFIMSSVSEIWRDMATRVTSGLQFRVFDMG